MALDVTSLNHRRAVRRWERVSVGDVLERLRWSVPNQAAIIGWPGAYASPSYARLSYRQADELACQVANGLLGRGLRQGDRVMLVCENSVEAVLQQHPAVHKAAVIGLPHDRWGEAVTAVVIPAPGGVAAGTDLAAELIAFCRDRLAGFETPKGVLLVDALPETVGGKVLKYKLRQQYADTYR